MLAVLGTSDSLTAVMSGAAATTNPTYAAWWRERFGDFNQPVGSLNGTTAVTLVSAPSQGQRTVESIQVFNGDTAAVTVTIAKVVSGTSFTLAKSTIPAGGTLLVNAVGLRVVDSSGQVLQTISDTSGAVGVASNGAAAAETGGLIRKTVLTLTNVPVTVGNTTGISFGGTKIYDFPAGRILILGSVLSNLTFDLSHEDNATPISGTMGGDISVGTTAPSDGTLTNEDVDLIPSTSIDPISSGVAGAALAASAQLDGTGTAKDAFINVLIDNADVADGASDVILVNGTLTLIWCLLGDY